jgi:hypothetical protein
MRLAGIFVAVVLVIACSNSGNTPPEPPSGDAARAPRDPQHAGVTGPHGDHTPRHGGLVLMQGDVHYEVVLAPDGRHQVWFSDALRNELPASVASRVTMEVNRPGTAPEQIALTIDDTGEAWIASGQRLGGEGIIVTLRYAMQGEPHQIEVPFVPIR